MALLITRGLGTTLDTVVIRDIASRILARVQLKDQPKGQLIAIEPPRAKVSAKIYLRGKLSTKTQLHGTVVEKLRIIGKIKEDE